MKLRIIAAAVLAAGVISMCGCEGKIPFTAEKTAQLPASWTAQADIRFGDNQAIAQVTRSGQGCWEFDFSEPPELCGVSMSLQDGELTASLGELTVNAGAGGYTVLPLLIAEGIDAADSAETSEKDGVLTIRTTAEGNSCTLTADRTSGDILTFRSPSNKLAVTFSEASPYTEEVGVIE